MTSWLPVNRAPDDYPQRRKIGGGFKWKFGDHHLVTTSPSRQPHEQTGGIVDGAVGYRATVAADAAARNRQNKRG